MRFVSLFIFSCVTCSVLAQAQAPSVTSIVDYGSQVRTKLRPYLLHVPSAHPNASVEVLVRMDDAGHVQSTQVKQSSGTPALDSMAVTALQRASPLPLDNGRPVPQISLVISNPAP